MENDSLRMGLDKITFDTFIENLWKLLYSNEANKQRFRQEVMTTKVMGQSIVYWHKFFYGNDYDWDKQLDGVAENTLYTEVHQLFQKLFATVETLIFENVSKTFVGGAGQTVTRVACFEEFNTKNLMISGFECKVSESIKLNVKYRTYSPASRDSEFAMVGIFFEVL